MTYANDRTRHAEVVDAVQEISRVIIPRGVIAEEVFIEDSALALLRHVCNPNASNAEPMLFCPGVNILPERLVKLLDGMSGVPGLLGKITCLREAIGMSSYYRDIARSWVWIVQRNVLLDS